MSDDNKKRKPGRPPGSDSPPSDRTEPRRKGRRRADSDLPKVLELAKRPNAVIKVSGACTLSREPYPFQDIWDPLACVFDAWGFDRCLWGTDWTRAFAVVNYEQAARSTGCGLNLARTRQLESVLTPKVQPQAELLSGRAKFSHMVFEKPIDLAIHDEVGAPEIQELLPLGIAIADHPGVRPTVEGVCRINHGGPALVTLGEQQHVAVAADPGVGTLRPNWFGAERDLPTRCDYLRPFGQQERNARLFTCASGHGDDDVRVVEVVRRLETLGIVLVNQK